jgi:hypothetical protein
MLEDEAVFLLSILSCKELAWDWASRVDSLIIVNKLNL